MPTPFSPGPMISQGLMARYFTSQERTTSRSLSPRPPESSPHGRLLPISPTWPFSEVQSSSSSGQNEAWARTIPQQHESWPRVCLDGPYPRHTAELGPAKGTSLLPKTAHAAPPSSPSRIPPRPWSSPDLSGERSGARPGCLTPHAAHRPPSR